jgi:Ca2+-binding RTX toxin-like protein
LKNSAIFPQKLNDATFLGNAGYATGEAIGSDRLIGIQSVITGAGDDKIYGSNSDNVLAAGAGNDAVRARGGNDTIIGGSGEGNDIYDGGAGIDTIVYTSTSLGIVVNLSAASNNATGSEIGTDQITGVENIVGGDGNDVLTGNAAANNLVGGTGDDTLNGKVGNDTLIGGLGNDTLIGGLGNDTYIVDSLNDVVQEFTGQGTDKIQTSLTSYTIAANIEKLDYTGIGNFTGTGNAGNNTLTGGAGNDKLFGGAGNDTLIGGAGNDTYIVDNPGDKAIETDAQGNDSGGNDTVMSSAKCTLGLNLENLTLTGSANLNGTGNILDNTITGNGGNNTLNGGAGNDTLDGGAGNDKLLGGLGDDILVYDSADSKIDGGAGTDTLKIGGSGIVLDLSQLVAGKIANIEKLDLTGSGDNSLQVNLASLLKLTGSAGHDLWVTGDAGDSVSIATVTGGWTDAGVANGYHQYTHITGLGIDNLYVQDTLTQSLVVAVSLQPLWVKHRNYSQGASGLLVAHHFRIHLIICQRIIWRGSK